MVRRGGRAHLQKQGGMLAALGVDEPIPPQRKENVHSNKPESVKEGVGPIKKELPQQLKTGELHATQQQKVIGTLRSKPDDNEPLLTTPSAPLSSIEINLCEAADKSVSRELFQSPLSTVSSSPDSTSDDSSALSPTSVNKMRRSTDFRSTASDNDGEYSCTSSEEDFIKSGDESRESYSDSESVESGESEVAPTYEESEDDEYSLEVEESEDELEFDEESDDEKWGKKDRRKNPKKSANKGTTKSIENINKQHRTFSTQIKSASLTLFAINLHVVQHCKSKLKVHGVYQMKFNGAPLSAVQTAMQVPKLTVVRSFGMLHSLKVWKDIFGDSVLLNHHLR
jgi:hypothetical protein